MERGKHEDIMTMTMQTGLSPLGLTHRDVGHSEGGEHDRVLVRVGVGGGDNLMLRWLRVRQARGAVSQDNVLR